jgi:hypothetical protein
LTHFYVESTEVREDGTIVPPVQVGYEVGAA